MKKSTKSKTTHEAAPIVPDIAGLVGALQQQLAVMERKIDTLISRLPSRTHEVKQPSHQVQQGNQNQRQNEPKQGNGFRERVLHKAICADCNKECEVPFKPSGDRPVYCKECFSLRKAGNVLKAKPAEKPAAAPVHQAAHAGKAKTADKKKPAEKKKAAAKRKK